MHLVHFPSPSRKTVAGNKRKLIIRKLAHGAVSSGIGRRSISFEIPFGNFVPFIVEWNEINANETSTSIRLEQNDLQRIDSRP